MAADAKAIDKNVEDLSKQIEALKSDIASIAHILSDLGRNQGEATAERVREAAHDLRARGERQLGHAQAQAQDLGHQAADAVRQQPAAAVGLAVGLGFILGFLTSRK